LDNERQLVRACISGDRVMQNKLYKHFAFIMMPVCLRYAKTRQDAEDILQEGFIKVFTKLDQYKFKGPLEGWVKKIIVNCALQKFRDKHRLYNIIDSNIAAEEFADKETTFDRINAKDVIKYIQALPNMYRLVFNLYVFEGLKHKEIALLLGISEGTSKSNLHDARRILQNRLHEETYASNIKAGA
jgi:RNA polymerase sigma factor (sigma-70 family)